MAVKFNEVIKIKREAMLLTQAQFGAIVGCTGGTISSFENGKDVGEAIVKCIKYTIKDLETKLTDEELGPYKLRCATEMAIAEPDEELRKEKLRTVCFSALKWSDSIDQKKKGYIR